MDEALVLFIFVPEKPVRSKFLPLMVIAVRFFFLSDHRAVPLLWDTSGSTLQFPASRRRRRKPEPAGALS